MGGLGLGLPHVPCRLLFTRAEGAASIHPPTLPAHRAPPPGRYDLGLPPPLLAACTVCRAGVKRAHLVRRCRWVPGAGALPSAPRRLQQPLTAPAATAACACQVDARMDGGLLLELYSRDGVGCMISTDFYEGIRRASITVRWVCAWAQSAGRLRVQAGALAVWGSPLHSPAPHPLPPCRAGPGLDPGAAAAAGGAGSAGAPVRGAAAERAAALYRA